MKQLTLQQVFDNAWNAFVVRGEGPGMDDEATCRYRAPNGCKCALGHSIPDDLYARNLEAQIKFYPIFKEEDYEALEGLQHSHDTVAHNFSNAVEFTNHIEIELRCFAGNHNLTIPAVFREGAD